MKRLPSLLVLWLLPLLAASVGAAPPIPPQVLSYQAVLLDDQGLPRVGTVDLSFRIHDAASGGTLVYVQELLAVPLNDGVFSVTLGPTGAPTDTPVDPLTTDLNAALVGDVGITAPDRFLEVTVGAEGALSRSQILIVPYAMHATTATTAEVATTATNFGGLPGEVFAQIFAFGNADGGPFANSDPEEGVGDLDGDGILNFIDPDNDGDGISDKDESNQGSNLNLVTPVIDQLIPTSGIIPIFPDPVRVGVAGANFDPGISVGFDGQTPVPLNVTSNGFDVDLDPVLGVFDLVVTNPNGETTSASFEFLPTPDPPPHSVPIGANQLTFDSAGASFAVGGDDAYAVNLGTRRSFPSEGGIAIQYQPTGELAAVRCRASGVDLCSVEFAVDSDGDLDLLDETATLIEVVSGASASIGSPSLRFDPAGRPAVGYVRIDATPTVVVAHDRDGNGDFAGPSERVDIEAATANALAQGRLAIDSAGRVAYAWGPDPASSTELRVAWDRSGDGDFGDTVTGNPEVFSAPVEVTGSALQCLGTGFDGSDALVVVRSNDAGGVKLYRDNNDDGDFADVGERPNLTGGPSGGCDARGDAGVLTVVHTASGFGMRVLRDLNDDGDFGDAGENVDLEPGATSTALQIEISDGGSPLVASETFFFD